MNVTQTQCAFNVIYSLAADHEINGELVSGIRRKISSSLADTILKSEAEYDAVIPIPNTGIAYAKNIAKRLGIEYINPFKKVKNSRTLSLPKSDRKKFYERFLCDTPLDAAHQNVLVVDEALISGTTAFAVADWLKPRVKNFAFAFASPPMINYCMCGVVKYSPRIISVVDNEDDINESVDKFNEILGSSQLYFIEPRDFQKIIDSRRMCSLCFANFANNIEEHL